MSSRNVLAIIAGIECLKLKQKLDEQLDIYKGLVTLQEAARPYYKATKEDVLFICEKTKSTTDKDWLNVNENLRIWVNGDVEKNLYNSVFNKLKEGRML